MFTYKNTSRNTRKFYGVIFNPGDVKSVPGYINDPKFIRVSNSSAVTQKPEKSSNAAVASRQDSKKASSSTKANTASTKSQASNKIKSEEELNNG